ncbi:MAG: hypothetical protein EOP82_06650 [Variovorax sp.]|nr:MAG: hypothetical protein EOP82_06650 [Variovorax sp.]
MNSVVNQVLRVVQEVSLIQVLERTSDVRRARADANVPAWELDKLAARLAGARKHCNGYAVIHARTR